MLSREQEFAFEKFCRGESMLISGPGGTGKSYLIKLLVEHMISTNNNAFQLTSTTGCSSKINGKNLPVRTINSWSGVKLCKGDNKSIVDNTINNRYTIKSWRKIETLIIDEVSMMSCKMFDVLVSIARSSRGNNKSFGGIIPIQILPTRKGVLEVNTTEYEKVLGVEHIFKSTVDSDYKT
jgi:ATP-dependent DNA helicase PIF1